MIDPFCEELISFAEAAKTLPRRRAGKKTHIATFYRWSNVGIHGIKLEFLMVGATRCTSKEALARFFAALTAHAEGQPVAPPPRMTAARRKQIEAAERRLEKAGV